MEKRFYMFNFNLATKKAKAIALLLCICFFTASFVFVGSSISPALSVSSAANPKPVVIIDAGHGGADGGALSARGTMEKDINLCIAHKLRAILLLNGFRVIMTRENDTSLYDKVKADATLRQKKVSDISTRIEITNDHPDAIFVSIHQNIFSSPSVCGTQVFYTKNDSSKQLAEIMQTVITTSLGQSNQRDLPIRKLMSSISNTGVLVECGFLSNPNEEKLLLDNEYQNLIAFSIFEALKEYLSMYR